MFFSFDILVKKNGRFALVWQFIHDKKRISKARERDLLAIDVSESCTELRNYMPSGKYSSTETKQKMSLYLLSQLFYGIVLLHNLQTTAYLDNLQGFAKSLLRVSAPEPRNKRKRLIAIGDDGDDAESTSSKRRRIPRPGVPTMMDLTQPKSYMRESTPIPHLVDPLLEMMDDDNFEVKGSSHGTLLDWNMDDAGDRMRRMSRKVSIANIDMLGGEDRSGKRPRVSISDIDYLASPEALRRPTGQFDVSRLSIAEQLQLSRPPSPMQEIPRNLQELLSPRLSQLSDHVAAQRAMQQLFSGGTIRRPGDDEGEEDEEEDEEFILEPLAKKTPTRRTKPKRGLQQHDERVTKSEAELSKQSENVSRLERSRDRVLAEMKKSRRDAYFAQLTNPVPAHLLGIRFAGLNPAFETVTCKVNEVPLTFRQASRVDYDEMRRNRRLQFEIVSWNSEGGGVHDAYTPGVHQSKNNRVHGRSLTPSVIVPESVKHVRAPSFTMEDTPVVPKHSSITAEQRRLSSFENARRASTPVVLAEESGIAYNELRDATMNEDFGVGDYRQHYQQQSYHEEEIHPVAQQLLNLINVTLSMTEGGVIQFSDVVEQTHSRAERARGFLALLSLLKHHEVKAKQPECWGSIFIKRYQQPKEEQPEESSSVRVDLDSQDVQPDAVED